MRIATLIVLALAVPSLLLSEICAAEPKASESIPAPDSTPADGSPILTVLSGQAPAASSPGAICPDQPVPDLLAPCAQHPCSSYTLLVNAGLDIMEARFDNNMAYGIEQTANRTSTSPGQRLSQRVDIDQQFVAAPELTLGFITDSGLGARVRYWYFREGTDQAASGGSGTTLFSAAPLGLSLLNGTSTMEVTSKLQVQTLDAEGIYALQAAKWNILFAGGVRYAQIDQTYNAYVPQSGDNTVVSSNSFSGAGPTVALELHRRICDCGLGFYGDVRYSLVFGSSHQQASIPDQNIFAQDQRNVGIGIAEMELGLEYTRTIGNCQVFGQVAVVGQNWGSAGNSSRSSVNVVPGGSFVGASYSGDSDINFLGLAIRFGVNF